MTYFRERYPDIPVLALTATATEKVREDIVKVLQMRNALIFLTSFNRPNLSYEVRNKNKKVVEDVANLIKHKYNNQTGIVYCISKKDCENLSKSLKKDYKVLAAFYHAEVPVEKRNKIQEKWTKGLIKVLVATVAFGMGIDKQNVRFVVHYSLPKSIENYYQESGRAGRDGKPADCILFYNYGDKIKQDFLIHKGMKQEDRQNQNFHQLHSILEYCEDIFTCRRQLQLAHFGEEFDRALCKKTCDNCKAGRVGIEKDMTKEALQIIRIIEGPRTGLNTLHQIASLLKGGNTRKNENLKFHDSFGVLKAYSLDDIEKILRRMVFEDILREKSVKSGFKGFSTVMEKGPNIYRLKNNQLRVKIKFEAKSNEKIQENYESDIEDSPTEIQPVPNLSKNPKIMIYTPQILQKYEYTPNVQNPTRSFDQPVIKTLPRFDLKDTTVDVTYGKCNDEDMYQELYDRLELVRKRLARQKGTSLETIANDSLLHELCRDLPIAHIKAPNEFLKEIKHFADTNNLPQHDPFAFELDLGSIDFDSFPPIDFDTLELKRKSDFSDERPKKLPMDF